MRASSIRELAASKGHPALVAAAFFESTVQVWDCRSQTKISEFPTVFCAGANNLALSPLGEMLVAGLSRSRGKVVAYDVPSGRKIWEQRLVYPSSLRFHPSGLSILCIREHRSVLRLDVHTGNVIEVIDGIEQYIEELSGDVLSVPVKEGNTPIQLTVKGQIFNVAEHNVTVLDAQFSPNSVCLCEASSYLSGAGGLVRCVSRVDGSPQWTFDPGPGSHVVRLHYSPGMDVFFGILWNSEKGECRSLMRFESTSGISERVCEFKSWEDVFLGEVNQLVTSAGEIRDLSSGALVGRFNFPQKIYHPDS